MSLFEVQRREKKTTVFEVNFDFLLEQRDVFFSFEKKSQKKFSFEDKKGLNKDLLLLLK